MMTNLASPTRVLSLDRLGIGDLERAAVYLSGRDRPSVVVVRDARPFPELEEAFLDLERGFGAVRLDRIVPNPRSEDIGSMVGEAKGRDVDLVIGVGGGSALDSAKAVSLMLANPGLLEDYLGSQPGRTPERKGPKLLLIPTTTGTGSEVTRFGVYTDRSGRKHTLASPFIQPDAALLVASAVQDIPPALLAATAYDAITHALETLWNRNATSLSDSLATDALCALLNAVTPAFAARSRGSRDASVTALLEAACLAGAAFNITGTAAIHALSFVLSEEWHQSHGLACAFFVDSVYQANLAHEPTLHKLAAAARRLPDAVATGDDEAAAAWLGRRLVELRSSLKLPATFAELGVERGALGPGRIAELFDKIQSDRKLGNNAVALDREAVRALVAAKLG
ncbi:MAG TPA: iron-containing alcohol dehydrogenase [Rectinemataceae bacterium]|nr:iron-containing alcohol dehydrogenase [Rectinemataceae bacterium]